MKYNPKTTAIPEIIPVVLICTAGIILSRPDASLSCSFLPQGLFCPGRMHLYLALLLHRDYFHRPDASLSCSFVPQGLFPPAGCISILLFCSTGIILPRSDASLSSSFASQGLFPPAGCIPSLLFCSTGIISASRMHLYLAFFFHRDYFGQPNASLSCSFLPQGLFPPPGFISILLFSSTGIILPRSDASLSSSFASQGLFPPAGCISIFLFCPTGIISAGRIHPQLALFFHRDYFRRSDSSLSCSFLPQGLFPPSGFISILLFCYTGIISTGRMHLYLALLLHRDDFHRPNASLSSSFVPQGLFLPAECISILLFSSTGIISAVRMHLYLALFFHRDYFCRPDASLSSSFASQGLFPPVGFIPSLLFSSTGIISASRMQPQLALFFHRDYFRQPNASLIRAPVKYQRPNFYYTGNTRMASADTLCKKLPQDRQKQSVLSLSILYFCRYGDILFW